MGYNQINFKREIVSSVERINLKTMKEWEPVAFKDQNRMNLASFSMYPVPYDANNLLILGGWDPREN